MSVFLAVVLWWCWLGYVAATTRRWWVYAWLAAMAALCFYAPRH